MSAENDNSPSSFELQQGVSDDNSKVFIRQALEALINGAKEPGDPDEKEYKINVKLTFTPSPMKKVWVARSSQELNSSTVRNEPLTKERKQTFKGKLSWSSDDEENRRGESVKDLEESERVSEDVALTFSDSEENRHSLNSSFSKKSKKKPENEQTLEQTDDSTAQASDLQKSSDAVECALPTVETSPNSQNESIAEESILANKTGDTPTEEKSEIYEDLAAFSSELWDSNKWDSFCTTVDDLKKMHHKNGAQTSSRNPQKNKACAKKKDTSSQKSTQEGLNEGNSDRNLQEIPEKEIGGNGVTPENLLLFCSRLQSSDLDDYFNTKSKKKRDKPKEETADAQLQVDSDRISDLGNSELESPPIQGFKKKKNKHEKENNEDPKQHTNETEMKVHNDESELDSSSSSVRVRKRKGDKKRDNKELNNDPSNETKTNGNIAELQTRMTIDNEATTDDEEFQSSQIFRSRKPAMGDKAKDSSTQEEFAKELLECMEICDGLGHQNEAGSNSKRSKKNKGRTGVDEDLENSEIREASDLEDRRTFSSPKKSKTGLNEDLKNSETDCEGQCNFSSPKKSKKRKKREQEAPTSDDTAADDDSGCPPEDVGIQESDLPTDRKKKPKSRSNGENWPVDSVPREEISVDREILNQISTDEKTDIVQEEPGTSVKKKNKRKVHNSGDEMASASEADIPQSTDGESKIPQKSMLEEILGAINNVYAEDQSSKKSKKKKRLEEDKDEAVVKSDETAPDDETLQDSNLPNKRKKKHKSGGSSKEDLAVDSAGKVETSSETESGLSRESEILGKSESPTKKKKWLKSVQEVTESSSKIEEEEVYDTGMLNDYFAPVVEDEVLQGSKLSTRTKKKKRHLGDDGESTDNALKEESIELYFKDEDEAVQEKELAPKKKKKHKFLQDHQEELSVYRAQEEESNLNGDIILDGQSELPTKKKKKKRKLHEDLDELAHDDAASEILPLESESPEAKKKKKKKRRRSLEEEKPTDLDLAHEEEIVEARDVEAVLEEPALPTKRKKHHKSTRCQNEIDLIGCSTHINEIEESAVDADMDSVEIGHDPEGGSSIMVSPRKKSKKKQKHHENTEESEGKTGTEIPVDNDSSENYSHKKRRESKEYHVLKNVQEPIISELHREDNDAQNEQYAYEDDACQIDTTLYIHEGSLEKDSVKSNISSDSPHSSKSKSAVKRRRTSSVSEDNNPPALKKSDSRVQPQSILADLMYTENPKVSNRNDSIKIKSEPRRVCLNEDSDVEDAVDRAKEAKALSASRNNKIKSFDVMIDWKINPLHMIETRICGAPDKQQWELINSLGVDIKNGVFTKEEDTQIMENWRRFCEVHDWGDDPEPFLNKKLLRNIPLKQRIDFARFIARGLDNRLLKSVFGRFQRLVDTKRVRGRFTAEEDRIIVEYIKKTDSNVPFADLAKLLNRNNTAVIKRCMVLSAKEDQQIKWTDENIKTFVRHLLKVTKKTEVEELRDFALTERHWAKMSKRMDLPVTKLRRAWIYTIQPRIYADEDIGTDEVKKKLIDLLYKNHEYDWRNVNWDEYAKEFEVEKLNGARLSKFLKTMVSYYCPTNIHDDLRACVKCLKKVVVTNVVFYHKKIRKLELDLSS